MRQLKLIAGLLLAAGLSAGCDTTPKKDPQFAPVAPVALPPKPEGNGAIFQAGYERRWFEDLRARRVGDILTVNLVEQTDASVSNSTEITKSNTTVIDNPTLLGKLPSFSLPGGESDATLEFDLQSSTDFSGEGDNEQRNALRGSVTVTVIEVLANGYLRVRGEKRIGTNGGNEYVKLSGVVRLEDIDTNNTVASTKVGDATLVYVGDGQVAKANVMGWLSKFFISALAPF